MLYIDTERKFSPGRLSQIAAARWPHSFQGSAIQQELTSRIIVLTPSSSADLLKRLKAGPQPLSDAPPSLPRSGQETPHHQIMQRMSPGEVEGYRAQAFPEHHTFPVGSSIQRPHTG